MQIFSSPVIANDEANGLQEVTPHKIQRYTRLLRARIRESFARHSFSWSLKWLLIIHVWRLSDASTWLRQDISNSSSVLRRSVLKVESPLMLD
jgi:hypothetical protein